MKVEWSLPKDANALGFGFEFCCWVLWQPADEVIQHLLMGGIICQITKLIWIRSMVIKFLGTIAIRNQPPISRADGVIAKIGRCDRRSIPVGRRVTELRDQRKPFQIRIWRQLAQLNKRWIDIDQAGWL